MQQVLIIANGELDAGTARELRASRFDRLVAVDGGADHCCALELVPDLIVGDLDSLAPDTLARFTRAGVLVERHPAHKDETDLELALLGEVRRGAARIVLAGALGGRLDMTLANVLLLARPELRHARVELWGGPQRAWLVRPPGEELHGHAGDTLSLLPLQGDAEGLATEGLHYPLADETLAFGRARGLSNVFTGALARIRIRAGQVLAVHTRGRA